MNFNLKLFLSCALLFNVALFISCTKEEKQYSPPIIQILSPGENASYSALDTVLLSARISDVQNITLITVTLKNENHVPVLRVEDIKPNSNVYDLRVLFPLSDKRLSGRYYFDVTAYNQDDYAASYRYITVSALSLKTKNILIVEKTINNTALYSFEIDSNKLKFLTYLKGDFMKSALDQDNEQMYTVGHFSGGLIASDPFEGTQLWTYETGILPQVPNFNDLGLWDNFVCVSAEDGRILGFNKSGNLLYESVLENGFKPEKILLHNELAVMVFEQLNRSSGQETVQVEYFPSGLNKGSAIFTYGKIEAMFSINWDEVIILSNAIDGQYMSVYNTENHYINKRDFGNYGDYSSVVQIDENTLAMTRGGDLYKYYIEQRQFVLLVKNYAPEVIRYNKAEFSLYCVKNGVIDVIDAQDGSYLRKFDLGINASSIELLYNR